MSKIVEKIKKLLRLSEDPTNEHVAEAAAQKAQELIEEHNIKGEMLIEKDDSPTREAPEWQGFLFQNKRVQPWAVNLCMHLANNNYGRIGIWSGKGVKFCGSKVDYELVKTMYAWIATQLQDMSVRNCHGVREGNSYKLGAVATIGERLKQAKKEAEARLEVEAMMSEVDGNNGLVLYQNAITTLSDYKSDVDAKANKDLGGSWRGGGVSRDASAYSRGIADGSKVSLTGHQLGG
jgi:hypothetical protein